MQPLDRTMQISRRRMLQASGAFSALGLTTAALPAARLSLSHDDTGVIKSQSGFPQLNGLEKQSLFTEIGVRTILNARGTYTIITGSRSLPEVKRAMYEASHYYVHLDEMMEGIGAQLGRLTGAEWGIATNGAEAAICLATIACIAGANVEKC